MGVGPPDHFSHLEALTTDGALYQQKEARSEPAVTHITAYVAIEQHCGYGQRVGDGSPRVRLAIVVEPMWQLSASPAGPSVENGRTQRQRACSSGSGSRVRLVCATGVPESLRGGINISQRTSLISVSLSVRGRCVAV